MQDDTRLCTLPMKPANELLTYLLTYLMRCEV
jgi:hypothetical protein